MGDSLIKAEKSAEDYQEPTSLRVRSSRIRPALPKGALYLATAEVFISAGFQLNTVSLLVDLFGLGPINMVMLNFAMGTIYATILTLLATLEWTPFVVGIAACFPLLLLIWMFMPDATCQICAYLAPALTMFTATFDPIRLAFMADQLTSAKSSYIRPYFTVIASGWFLGKFLVMMFTFLIKGPSMVVAVCGTIFTIFALYTVLVVFIQLKSTGRSYYRNVRFAAKEIYWKHEGKQYWEILHIGITISGYYAARLIINMALQEQIRSIQYNESVGQGALLVLPEVVAVVIALIMGFGIEPLLKRKNIKITDLHHIGLGMIFGCIAMIVAMAIQADIDKELKPPRRLECLLFLFNLLSSNTSFLAEVFGKGNNSFIQVAGTSTTAFISRNVVDVEEHPITVINLQEDIFNETHIQLHEGAIVSYVLTRDKFAYKSGLDLDTPHFLGKDSTLFIGCTVDNCGGKKISFHDNANHGGSTGEVELPKEEEFKVVSLTDGTYTVRATVDEEPMTMTDNFTTKAREVHVALVYEKEPGVPQIALFLISKPEKIPTALFIFQQIIIGFREAFFTVGLLRFLYYQTPSNKPARPFVYSAFFLICIGVPYIVTGGLRTSIFIFLEEFVIQAYLAYYACCVVLFINLANKYEHLPERGESDDEEQF